MTRGEFQFIGSEAWGRNTDVLKYDISKGSLIVTAEMDKNMEMEEYIKSKTAVMKVFRQFSNSFKTIYILNIAY
jgi:hypothetical protein